MRAISAAILAAVLLLTGCSGETSTTTDTDPRPTPVESTSSTPADEPVTLQESCPQLEAAYPDSGFPDGVEWSAYLDEVDAIHQAGDLETRNAIEPLGSAAQWLAAEPRGSELLDARANMRAVLDNLRDRCAAVGSSAFQ